MAGEQLSLSQKQCVPCRGGTPPLQDAEIAELQRQLNDGWKVVDDHHLERHFQFENFRQALDFTNRSASWLKNRAITRIFTWRGAKSD